MTQLDKAFIKAYSKSVGPLPAPHVRLAVEAPQVAATPADAVPANVLDRVPSPASEIAAPSPCEQGRFDSEHAMQSPHWPTPAGIATFARWEPQEAAGEAAIAAAPLTRTSDSSHKPPEGGTTSAAAAAVAELPVAPLPVVQRAAFEVDNFLWPETCRKLAATAAAAWSGLATELASAARAGQKIVLITSHRRGEGRTTLALCLANLLAQRHVRVALVDADFQKPQLAGQLKLLAACGWDEVVRGEQGLTESWIESLADGVTLAPLRPRPDSRGLTGNPRVKATLALLREQHDLVIVDAGALEDADDRELLALLGGTAQIDAALVVRDVRSGTIETLSACQKRLDALGIARWDVVENYV